MERPGQFAGKSIEDVDDSEFAEILRERQQRALASAAGIGGADTGAGPVHWYEHYNAKNSRAWLITDPADGRIPALTTAGQKAADARAVARKNSGRGPADSWEDRSLYDRCITRGVPGSMMPAIYGCAYDITQTRLRRDPLRDDSRNACDSDRRQPAPAKEHHLIWAPRGLGRQHARRRNDELQRARHVSKRQPRDLHADRALTPVGPNKVSGRSPSTTRPRGPSRGPTR
jgi:hypothetical protein